jgi:hypothetical protein
VPFVRVSRDKRGYEQISLFHIGGRRGKPSRPKLLYVFRTPPGVKVGREPFDETVRQAIESQNPGVLFDWKKLSNIPVPAPDVEYWRERRRAEKAAKQARRAEELAEAGVDADEGRAVAGPEQPQEESDGDRQMPDDEGVIETGTDAGGSGRFEPGLADGEGGTASVTDVVPPVAAEMRPKKRRRRRRHRGARGVAQGEGVAAQPSTSSQGSPVQPDIPAESSKLPEDGPKEA